MSYNGSGTFNINTAGQPVVTATTISSTAFNSLTADLATGLTTAVTKDGQTTPTANLPMGSFKLTGLANGSAATDSVAFGQISAFGVPGYTTTATAAGTTTLTVASTIQQFFTGVTTQTVTLPVATTLVVGFQFEITNMSTGVVTVNSSGAALVVAIVSLARVTVTCILASGTSAASWDIQYTGKSAVTGTGNLVFSTSPSFTTPTLGVASATSLATSAASPLLLTNGQLATVALTSQTVGATTLTIPDFASVVDEFTFKTKSQTMANKTLTAPTINGTVGTTGLTLPAMTLSGTVSGGGQQLNNIIIGTVTPLAGSFTTMGLSGDMTMTAASTFQAEGAAVASVAGATDIWAVSDGDTVHVTGVETITSLGTAPQAGCWKKLIFDGVLVLTQGANLNLNAGGANITTAAGDIAYVYADTTTQMDVLFFKKSGVANVVAAAAGWTIMTPQPVTSGSSVTFGSIPAGVKKIAVSFSSMSATAANRTFSVRLGDAGGLETTGYVGMALNLISTGGALTTNPVALSTDIQVLIGDPSAAGDNYSGALELTLENSSSFRWSFHGIVSANAENSGAQFMGMVSGVKALSAELTQLSVVVDGTFDGAGEVGVAYMS